jgi:hypothetical protein
VTYVTASKESNSLKLYGWGTVIPNTLLARTVLNEDENATFFRSFFLFLPKYSVKYCACPF